MTTQGFVLFGHIALVIIGFSLAAVLHAALIMMRAAKDVAELRQWPQVIARIEPLLPVVAFLILLTGAWLLHLSGGEFTWGESWVVVSLVGLVVVEATGGLIAPRSKVLRRAIRESEQGPITPELRGRLIDPWFWCVAHASTAAFLAIVFLMAMKPSGAWSVGVLTVVTLFGALTAVPFVRRPGGVASYSLVQRRHDRIAIRTMQRS